MCGILCLISEKHDGITEELYKKCFGQIRNRGPDFYNSMEIESINGCKIQLAASVLWLQGMTLSKQPIDTEKSSFLYNGDIFGGTFIKTDEKLHKGDTNLFLNCLENFPVSEITHHLAKIHGPYCFIWLNKQTKKLYFGRDPFGRRSLLISKQIQHGNLFLTSTALRVTNSEHNFIELPSIGVFCYDLNDKCLNLIPWRLQHKNFNEKLGSLEEFLQISINKKCFDIESNFYGEKNFTQPDTTDIEIFSKIEKCNPQEAFKILLEDKNWLKNVCILKEKLLKAIEIRITTQPKHCKSCITKLSNCNHCRVGILFSGGLDCTILALLTDKFLEVDTPIDLINVAFSKIKNFETPDRLTGLQSLEELKTLNPHRKWNFIPVNITDEELIMTKSKIIADLIYPLNTVLDDDLGCALWFASRAKTEKYESTCRVLLVGMGADELFGGYTRHRNAYKRKGFEGLHQCLLEDWQNISFRNLARDDRVVSDHGRQLRTPYLDENVVDYVLSLNVWQRTFPSDAIPLGMGDKILLRTLGYHLGLRETSSFKKRALQFGSRIADKKERGHDVSKGLLLLPCT